MSTRVLKFGGTSVETPAHVIAVARRVRAARAAGDSIIVVVSAMGQTTDELIRLAHRVSRTPSRRELDMLLTAGERISMTLLAMCLESLGCPAISFTGSQSGIVTDTRHSDARIRAVRAIRIEEELARGRVVIVAGFQGVSPEKEVTTLGRGGSDTTAVALAIRLGAERCEIYTDVAGVLTADPRIVSEAQPLKEIGYDPMIVLSHLGGRVLFRRAVLLARKYGMPVEVRSSLTQDAGTLVSGAPSEPDAGSGRNHAKNRSRTEEEDAMETDRIVGVALESPVHWVRIVTQDPASPQAGLPSQGSPLFLVFSQTVLPDGSGLVEFAACPDADLEPWLESARWGREARIEVERRAALVSLVGEGVLAAADVLRAAYACLQTAGIPVRGMHTGTLSLSFIVAEEHGEAACRALHRDLITPR